MWKTLFVKPMNAYEQWSRIYKWMIFHIGHLVYCRVTVDSLGCCLVLLRFLGMSTQNLTRSLEPGLDNRIVVGTWAMPGMRCRYVKNPFRDWWFLWFFSVSLVISPSKLSSRHIQITMTLSLSLKFHDSISILCPKYYLSCLWDSSFVCTKDSVDPLSSWLAV